MTHILDITSDTSSLEGKHIAVVGQGAISSVISYHLHKQNLIFSVLLRDQQLNKYEQSNLTYQYGYESETVEQYQISSSKNVAPNSVDILLIATKAFSVEQALADYAHLLRDNACILLCHNGMGTIEIAQNHLTPTQSLYFASTRHGAFKLDHSSVIHVKRGLTQLALCLGPANWNEQMITFVRLWSSTQWLDDIDEILWQKLAINAVINPITALNQKQNGSVLLQQYQEDVQAICAEIAKLAKTKHIYLDVSELIKQALATAKNTRENYSSMQQDVCFGRPTENEFISGFVVKLAKANNVSVPVNQKYYEKVAALNHRTAQ